MAEDALEERERLLRQAQAYAHIGYWRLEADRQTISWSDEIYRILGLDPAVTPSLDVLRKVVHPEDSPGLIDSLLAALGEGREHNVEYRVVRPGGEVRWVACKGAPVFGEGGKTVRLSGVFQDVTTRKLTEQQTRASLEEKEVLLREIHHRVKNNLQVVASLLFLQAAHASVPETVDALKESGRRIQLMAQIHNKLYRSKNLASDEFDTFLKALVEDIVYSYRMDSKRIGLDATTEPISLHIDQAIPCSQIVSELVSNSMKHAFPHGREGTIGIGLCREGERVVLWVEDDGVGMPKGFDWRQSNSLGLQVVEALAQQLNGTFTLTGDNGTRFRISF
ncbi:MAG: histidine kinase dimerization/phosphoacceptor domain -containing protein [Pseudomonadota bacterium]|nr:histidine kinase dimerization/phosphoacceptor domain -containing protein [Pseudomonadota bacterium]